MPTIAVSGASGHLGRLVTDELLARGVAPADLVLLTRTPETLAERTAAGIDVRAADFEAAAELPAALAGVQRLLLISTAAVGEARVAQHRAAIGAAAAAGVGRVAYTSAGNPVPGNPAAVMPDHRATEEALRASGLEWTILRNALYAEFEVPGAQQAAATGQFVANTGEGRTTYVSRADLAAAAAGALLADDVAGQTLDLTGAELLSAADRAALVADLTGRPVEAVLVDDDALVAGLTGAGIPAEGAAVIASFGAAIREGFLDQRTDAIERLAGRPPRALRDVLADAGVGA